MNEMILNKKVGFGWYNFRGSVAALNAYAELKDFFGNAGIGIAYPGEIGHKVLVVRPGLGEIEIELKTEKDYQVTLLRGKIASRIAGWLGKYN